ncbi:CRISPR-associated endoribonuclease Cas6 [Thermoanaerobacter pentosaceus]|uniref:CRISPR-associated endoribonuclease n=1 Tax=Thermoanaerobacter pentosaceus TaxID=694059 RepID=A0ABT9M2B3_9THEO|nr:CRISPR-associated endoribonuclease Cas6 [Thermoanaerobacter pentosaceus]MDP9750248.1 CRISPR-associated endoribonuclease Cas6 [Thermoanaerobacter pentosaceus]
MRITMEFIGEKNLVLPIHYNYIVQGFLYDLMGDSNFAVFLHDKGFQYEKRKFKLFTFSRIEGEFKILVDSKGQKKISITPPFKFTVASPLDEFIFDISKNVLKKEYCHFNGQKFILNSLNIDNPPVFKSKARIKFISPVVMYSTLKEGDIKYTYYYSPWDEKFSPLLLNNLLKKYELVYNVKAKDPYFKLYPLSKQEDRRYSKMIKYKNVYVKGWMGIYEVETTPELLELAYYTGLGAKNSQGFGCFEIIK